MVSTTVTISTSCRCEIHNNNNHTKYDGKMLLSDETPDTVHVPYHQMPN